jgi:hypothetical protein
LILYRCFAWDERARSRRTDGALWFPRRYQGEGRHDNPAVYGCLYLTDLPASSIVEQLARFRGQRFIPPMLVRRGLPLALAVIELADAARVIDLDEPLVLDAHDLRPSLVATRERTRTQQQALGLFQEHPDAACLRWWSTYESLWANFTIFRRAAPDLRLVELKRLEPGDPEVLEAAEFLGLAEAGSS